MISIEVILKDGTKTILQFYGTLDEFKELVRYDNGTTFLEDKDGYNTLVKQVSRFKQCGN